MIPTTSRCLLSAFTIALGSLLLVASSAASDRFAEADNAHHSGHDACPMAAARSSEELLGSTESPNLLGQDAFAALGEMRALLESDPSTDWSRVDLDALREHLVDMHQVVLQARVLVQPVPGGFAAQVTGSGRALDAIRRLVPAHSRFMDGHDGLRVAVASLPEDHRAEAGVAVTVTTADPSAVAKLRGLGFFGFLVAGDHHRPHHRAMAQGSGHP